MGREMERERDSEIKMEIERWGERWRERGTVREREIASVSFFIVFSGISVDFVISMIELNYSIRDYIYYYVVS